MILNVPVRLGRIAADAPAEEREAGEWVASSDVKGWPEGHHVHGPTPTEAVRQALVILSHHIEIVETEPTGAVEAHEIVETEPTGAVEAHAG